MSVLSDISSILSAVDFVSSLLSSVKTSSTEKKSYEEKLERATGANVYKYVLLINISALEGYVAQARLQAQQSFTLSKLVAIAGFVILTISIGLSVYFTIIGDKSLDAAYLAGVAGVLTEFIAGVFFYLYSKTLSQINTFHDKLVDMQKTALVYISKNMESEQKDKSIVPATKKANA